MQTVVQSALRGVMHALATPTVRCSTSVSCGHSVESGTDNTAPASLGCVPHGDYNHHTAHTGRYRKDTRMKMKGISADSADREGQPLTALTVGEVVAALRHANHVVPLWICNEYEDYYPVLGATLRDDKVLLHWAKDTALYPRPSSAYSRLTVRELEHFFAQVTDAELPVFSHDITTRVVSPSRALGPANEELDLDNCGNNRLGFRINDPLEEDLWDVSNSVDRPAKNMTATPTETPASVSDVHVPSTYMDLGSEVTAGAYTDATLQALAGANLDCFELTTILEKLNVTPGEMMDTLDFYIECNGDDCDLEKGRVGNRVFFAATNTGSWQDPGAIPIVATFF